MRSAIYWIMALALAAYAALCLYLYLEKRSFIFFPQPRAVSDAEHTRTLKLIDAQVVLTVTERPGTSALLYFGGNAEDVSLSLGNLSAAFPDHALYLMHYRGYGGSTGEPNAAALFADAIALFDQVHAEHEDIMVIGRSLGSGIAVYLASSRPVRHLVLVTPYDSMAEVAQHHYPYVPVRWLLRDRFESVRYAPQVTAPTTIIEAERDEVIPRTSTENLYAKFRPGVARYHRIGGADHNSVSLDPQYYPLLRGQ